MKKVFHGIVLLGAIGLLSGCAVKSGNEAIYKMSKEDMGKFIVRGKTTKEDLEKRLGQPQSVDFTSAGDEKWIYKNVYSQAKAINFIPVVSAVANGTNDKTRTLVIIFDQNGVVKNYSYSIAEGETLGGLIG
jgi:outer membrane protein assembly factor BamE (lipoprotein component of BamABCDE complex)